MQKATSRYNLEDSIKIFVETLQTSKEVNNGRSSKRCNLTTRQTDIRHRSENPVGIVTPVDLESLARVARKYQIPVIKITSGQRFALVGMQKEGVDKIWDELGMDVGKAVELCLHYVQACPGTAVCKFGTQDSLRLGTEIESFSREWTFQLKLKSAYPASVTS